MHMLEFKKLTDFPRGTLYNILCDAYSYDDWNKRIWDGNWKETDDFLNKIDSDFIITEGAAYTPKILKNMGYRNILR